MSRMSAIMRPALFMREPVTLRDGRKVTLRPIDRADAEKLIDLHNHLSPESQYFRFFGPKPKLSPSEAEYLANVDFHNRFAIVGEVTEAHLPKPIEGRPDVAILEMKDLGDNVFYGG